MGAVMVTVTPNLCSSASAEHLGLPLPHCVLTPPELAPVLTQPEDAVDWGSLVFSAYKAMTVRPNLSWEMEGGNKS